MQLWSLHLFPSVLPSLTCFAHVSARRYVRKMTSFWGSCWWHNWYLILTISTSTTSTLFEPALLTKKKSQPIQLLYWSLYTSVPLGGRWWRAMLRFTLNVWLLKMISAYVVFTNANFAAWTPGFGTLGTACTYKSLIHTSATKHFSFNNTCHHLFT